VLVTATEIKNNFGQYLNMVMEDNDVVISKNGKKVARLTPYVTDIERYFTIRETALDYQYGGKKVSYEEFMLINEKSTVRMEFINGEIVMLASPRVSHQDILGKLYVIFMEWFRGKKCRPFIAPFDVHFRKKDIKDPDVMQPDLLVACDLDLIDEKDRYMGTPTLVLEILSSSTRNKDMVDKLNTYMTSGVEEYWIADPKQQKIIIYNFKKYEIEDMEVYNIEQMAVSMVFSGLKVSVRDIFTNLY